MGGLASVRGPSLNVRIGRLAVHMDHFRVTEPAGEALTNGVTTDSASLR